MDVRFFWTLFLRRLHWFLLILVICSAAGTFMARTLPTVYQAEARLVVESEQIPDELAASTVRTQSTEQLQIIQQRILTRDILVLMSDRLQIYAPRTAAGHPPLSAEEIVDDLRGRISINIVGSAQAQRRGVVQATIVTVGFAAPTAELAASVTNELVALILREDVAMRTGVARQTLEFFEQDVVRLEKELSQKAAVILEFKQANISALPDSLDFRRSQQADAQERLIQITRLEADLLDRRTRLVRLHEATSGSESTSPVRERTPEQIQLQALRDELAKQLAVLSPENPRVKMIAAQVAALEQVVANQIVGSAVGENGQPLSAYAVQLADLDAQIDSAGQQRTGLQADIDRLEVSIAATPANAMALETLERDYSATKIQYDRALDNKSKAATGDTIETLSKGQRITVIEQAIAPRKPTSPNRPLIMLSGVGGGVMLGLIFLSLLELMNQNIRRPADLTKGLGITPFATLPYMRTQGETIRRITIAIAVGTATLAAGLWLVHTRIMPLDLLVENLWRGLG